MNNQVHQPDIEALYRVVDSFISEKESKRPPCIGISSNRKDGLSCIAEAYVQAVTNAGGAPFLIPVITDLNALTAIVSTLDGLVMTGGGDINPRYQNEEPIPELGDVDALRDEYDLILLKLAADRQLPIFGICRGHQIINVAFGGSVYQDIYAQSDRKLIKHSQSISREQPSHSVTTEPNSLLFLLLKGENLVWVNSFHHQAIRDIAPGFRSSAIASDGVNEGIEAYPFHSIFSVQWHPESMAAEGDEIMKELFSFVVEEAFIFKKAKSIHRRILTVDSHTDTPMIFPDGFNLGIKEGGKVNLPLMEEGLLDAAFMVAYLPQGLRDDNSLDSAKEMAIKKLNQVKEQERLNGDRMGIAYTPRDVLRLKRQEKKAIFLGIENGYAIGKDIRNVALFKEMGVSYITLVHNGNNDICDSAKGEPEWEGLSPFGKEVVHEMNRLGVMIDVSHAAESTFWDVIKESEQPIIASHSSCRALCDHPRNLTDEQLKAVAANGGVVQVCLYKGFINKDEEKASLSDAIEHIDHIVSLIGIDHVGIGSDFDGDGGILGCDASNELINITVKLIGLGYTEEELRKLWGGNLMRVMQTVQDAAEI